MARKSRRKFLAYLFGSVSALGAVIVSTYLGIVTNIFKGEQPNEKTKKLDQENQTLSKSRLPPGQIETDELRVLHVGEIPSFDPNTWMFEVAGLVEKPFTLKWNEFRELPEIESVSDFHCVTGWSKLDNTWSGVQFTAIAEMAMLKDTAKYATILCDGGYTTSLPLKDFLREDVLLAYKFNGEDLEPKHGGPLRLIVPHKYAYKSAKWIRKIMFTEEYELGYWEVRGYSNTADPWTQDRFS